MRELQRLDARDDRVGGVNVNCGLRIADCGFDVNPQSAIRNPTIA